MEISESNFCDLTQTPRNVLVIDLSTRSAKVVVSKRQEAKEAFVHTAHSAQRSAFISG